MRRYAAVIDLNGKCHDVALQGMEMLKKEFDIQFISSTCHHPHVTISSGVTNSIESIKNSLSKISKTVSPFMMKSNGLGIFVSKTPVLYIRWLLNKALFDFFTLLSDNLRSVWADVSQNTIMEFWQPKSTIAFSDITYDQLPQVLKKLQQYNFKQSMYAEGITLVEVTDKGDFKLDLFDFKDKVFR